MNNSFGIENNILKQALMGGILVKRDGNFVEINGFISLVYIPQMGGFVLAYGNSPATAGAVLVSEYEKDWILK